VSVAVVRFASLRLCSDLPRRQYLSQMPGITLFVCSNEVHSLLARLLIFQVYYGKKKCVFLTRRKRCYSPQAQVYSLRRPKYFKSQQVANTQSTSYHCCLTYARASAPVVLAHGRYRSGYILSHFNAIIGSSMGFGWFST